MNAHAMPTTDAYASLRREYAACPLCRGAKLQNGGSANVQRHPNWHDALPPTIEWMRCDDCRHVFTRHAWTDAGLAEVFRKALSTQVAGGDPDQKRQVWKPVAQAVMDLFGGYGAVQARPAPPEWLDVGFGDGALIMTAAEFGFEAVGLDARAEPVQALAKLGYKVEQQHFMKLSPERKYDVISMCDLLEHLEHPPEALAHAASILNPGGVLLVSLPNMDSSSWKLMDIASANPYWSEIEHHHNFTRASLTRLMAAHGFRAERFDIPFRYKAQMEIYARKVG